MKLSIWTLLLRLYYEAPTKCLRIRPKHMSMHMDCRSLRAYIIMVTYIISLVFVIRNLLKFVELIFLRKFRECMICKVYNLNKKKKVNVTINFLKVWKPNLYQFSYLFYK